MLKPTVPEFLEIMGERRHQVFTNTDKPYNLNIVGFRNKYGRKGHFDDTIAVYYISDGEWKARYFPATTKPGLAYLLTPLLSRGTAILVPGQYVGAYMLGLHKGRIPALVQLAAVKVYRDANRDLNYDTKEETIDRGMFGINIHPSNLLSSFVGIASAGCQVIKGATAFDEFLELCYNARLHWGNRFTYTLVEI